MLRALRVMLGHLGRGPTTVRLPASVPVPQGFRGRVLLDPSRCLACGVCAYVCVSGAVGGRDGDGAYTWTYEPARCAFCARCADHCPGRALSMAEEPAPAYARVGDLAVHERVPFPPCPECGAPTRPVTAELLAVAFGGAEDTTADLLRRCERCRRRRLQRAFVAPAGPPGRDAP